MSGEKKRGRPSTFTAEIGDKICERLARGETLRKICRDDEFPDSHVVIGWAMNKNLPFYDQYARARQIGYQVMAEEVIEICDDGTNDFMEDKKGNLLTDHENINRSRLRVDTRKWLLSKALPKIYGDKLVVSKDVDEPDKEMIDVTTGNLLKLVK